MIAAAENPSLVLDLDGYEGPIDLLLALARDQKVDLARISILQLADQYLAFIAKQRRLHLEIAADYLVMAAWLAYLKSRLLLPDPPEDESGPSAIELAEALAHRLRLLEAMQRVGASLMARPLLGRDVFGRGAPEGLATIDQSVYELSLDELLKAYGTSHSRQHGQVLTILPSAYRSLADAMEHLQRFVGHLPDWQELMAFLPDELQDGPLRKSALAATFAATLELAKAGKVELRQDRAFGPLYLRSGAVADVQPK